MTSKRPSESELAERAAQIAEDRLAHTPEPAIRYATESAEADAAEHHQLDQEQARVNDALASDKVERRILLLEEAARETNLLLKTVLEKFGFVNAAAAPGGEATDTPPAPVTPSAAAIRTIYIAEGQAPWEKEPVWCAIDGDGRYLPRGKYIQVTQAELEVLLHAVIEGYHYPVVNDNPLASKTSRDHMTVSIPVPYSQPRFAVLVQPGA
jgi:hypothetical protein